MPMRSKVMYQSQGSSEVKLGGKCWFPLFGSPLKSLRSNWNQTWVKDAIGVPFCILVRSKVMYQSQGSSEVELGGKN